MNAKTTPRPCEDLTWEEVHLLAELEFRLKVLLESTEDVLALSGRLQRHEPVRMAHAVVRLWADCLHPEAEGDGPRPESFWTRLHDLFVNAGSTHARMEGEIPS